MTKLKLEAPVYQVGDYLYSMTSGVISKNDSICQLRSKESALLNVLIETFPEVTSREKIVEKLYQNTYATDATINQLVKRLRKSLEDNNRSLIRTISKQGYLLSSPPDQVEIEKKTDVNSNANPHLMAQHYSGEHNFEGLSKSDEIQLKRFENPAAVKQLLETTKTKQRFWGAAVTSGCVIAFIVGYGISMLIGHEGYQLKEVTTYEAEQMTASELQSPVFSRDAGTNNMTIYIEDNNEIVLCESQDGATKC
ncbi:winged helix-turn-helix domain-containing protein [Vibrio lamellibrachiae]|uniref:winged helix-turn-helix domain-containing protein n=1 Tax=Vibrio lamellibrachiae TaxID=2910253 RepID=UPI003D0CD421